MRHIIIYKLDLVNTVYKLFGNIIATIERTDKLISIVTKKGFRYLLLNKYKRSFVRDRSKLITAKKSTMSGKKYAIFVLGRKSEIAKYDKTAIKAVRQ